MGFWEELGSELSRYFDQWYECIKDDYWTGVRLVIIFLVTIRMIVYIVKLDFSTFEDETDKAEYQQVKPVQKAEEVSDANKKE